MKKTKSKEYPDRAKDVYVTQEMLYGVRDELKALIRSEIKSLDSKFLKIDSDFKGLESKFNGLESRFSGLESKFAGLESKMELVHSEIFRLAVLMEEQNAKNNTVLDGLSALFYRQERLETKFEEFQK